MSKKFVMILAALTAIVMLFGACAQEEAEDTATAEAETDISSTIVIAEVDGTPIYKDAFDEVYDYYAEMYTYYGYDVEDEETKSELQKMVLEGLVSDQVFENKLTELGYLDDSDELLALAEEYAHEEVDYYIEAYYLGTIEDELGEDYTEEELAEAMDEYDEVILTSYVGLTWDELVEEYKRTASEVLAKEDLVGNIVPSDAEVEEKYNTYVEDYTAELEEDPGVYVTDALAGATTYYTPAGVRIVKQVLIMFDEDTLAAINTLRSAGYDAQAEIIRDNALEGILEEAEEALEMLQSGDLTFDEAIETYSDDDIMPEDGYPVVEGVDEYVEYLPSAEALALVSQGDMTEELVKSDYGYHIIQYVDDVAEGEIDYDEVYQDIYDELLATLQSEAWEALQETWKSEIEIEYYYENLD